MSGIDPAAVPSSLQRGWKAVAPKLTEAFGRTVDVQEIAVWSGTPGEVADQLAEPLAAAVVSFQGAIAGDALVGVSEAHARVVADLMMGGDGTQPAEEFGELQLSAVSEAFGQSADCLASSFAEASGAATTATAHEAGLGLLAEQLEGLEDLAGGGLLYVLTAGLTVGEAVMVQWVQIVPAWFLQQLHDLDALAGAPAAEGALTERAGEELVGARVRPSVAPSPPPPATEPSSLSEDEIAALLGGGVPTAAPSRRPAATPGAAASALASAGSAQTVRFDEFGDAQALLASGKIDLVLDIPVPITVELGRAQMRIRDILDLGSGAVVELDKASGEPVDILAGGRPIAKGEVVVVDENFGVRILQILRPLGGTDEPGKQ